MTELEQTVSRFCDAWNRHDAAALAAMWTDDGELNHPWGFHAVGRPAIRELLAQEHAASMARSRISVLRIASRGEERNVLADIDTELTGVLAPNGRAYDLQPTMCAMFVREDDGWRIRTLTPVAHPRR